MADSGTPRKLTLDGVTFDVIATTNVSFNRSKWEKEGNATTGRTRMKVTKIVQNQEGWEVATTPSELELLNNIVDKINESVTMSTELADGSVYKASGQVHMDPYESEDGKTPIKLIPDNGWTPFVV